MGHTSIKTTMDIYAETTEKKKQETENQQAIINDVIDVKMGVYSHKT